jgi:hypothetical protein
MFNIYTGIEIGIGTGIGIIRFIRNMLKNQITLMNNKSHLYWDSGQKKIFCHFKQVMWGLTQRAALPTKLVIDPPLSTAG